MSFMIDKTISMDTRCPSRASINQVQNAFLTNNCRFISDKIVSIVSLSYIIERFIKYVGGKSKLTPDSIQSDRCPMLCVLEIHGLAKSVHSPENEASYRKQHFRGKEKCLCYKHSVSDDHKYLYCWKSTRTCTKRAALMNENHAFRRRFQQAQFMSAGTYKYS